MLIIVISIGPVLRITIPPLSSIRSLTIVRGVIFFSLMDGFSGYNQINILSSDQHKTAFIYPWGTFAYKKIPFGLKNVGATFQRAMSYSFHDIHHIVQPYLDDLPAHSSTRKDQPEHLRQIFLRCRCYNIRVNPHKFIFCVDSG